MSHLHVSAALAATAAFALPPLVAGQGQDAPPGSPPAGNTARADLPPARTIIERAVAQLGGAEALDAIRTIEYRIAMEAHQGDMATKSAMDVRTAGPRKLLVGGSSGPASIDMGRIGDVAWTRDAGGVRLLPVSDITQMSQLDLYGLVLDLPRGIERYRTVDETPFAGATCRKVAFSDDPGASSFGYFDAADGALRGIEQTQNTQGIEVLLTTMVGDWKQVGPLRLFTTASMTVAPKGGVFPPITVDLTFSEAKFNSLADDLFTVPEDVQKLAAARAAPPAAAPPTTTRPALPPKAPPASRPASRSPLISTALKNIDRWDLGQLRMFTGLLEAQLPRAPEADRADIQFLLGKLKARIAVLEAEAGTAAGGDQGEGGKKKDEGKESGKKDGGG